MVSVEALSGSDLHKVSFFFPGPQGHQVNLTGSFNDWDPTELVMVYSETDNGYSGELQLRSGTYEYKFIVDGDWMADQGNPNFSANDFGTLNSVLNIG